MTTTHVISRCLALTLSLACVLVTASSSAQDSGSWQPLVNAPDAILPPRPLRHDDIMFVNDSTGWIVNTAGQIYRTDNGGDLWELQLDDRSLNFRSVAFVDEKTGFTGLINNEPDVLYATTDGGANWNNISSTIEGPVVQGICGLQAVSDSVIYGVGAYWGTPRFIFTRDAGESWSSVDMSPYAATLVDLHFFDENRGLAVGGSGASFDGQAVVLLTADGGLSWDKIYETIKWPTVDGEWGWKISFPSDSVGYVSVEFALNDSAPAKVLKTTDGGLSWTTLTVSGSVDASGLQGIGFIDDMKGWVGGRGTTSLTTDGGASWAQLAPYEPSGNPDGQLDPRLNRIFVLSDSLAYAVGRFAYKYVPAAPVSVTSIPERTRLFEVEQNYPNPADNSTTISFRLHEPLPVAVRVISLTGRVIRTLSDGIGLPEGRHSIEWDARDDTGQPVASGVYLYIIDIGDAIEMKKMVIVR